MFSILKEKQKDERQNFAHFMCIIYGAVKMVYQKLYYNNDYIREILNELNLCTF